MGLNHMCVLREALLMIRGRYMTPTPSEMFQSTSSYIALRCDCSFEDVCHATAQLELIREPKSGCRVTNLQVFIGFAIAYIITAIAVSSYKRGTYFLKSIYLVVLIYAPLLLFDALFGSQHVNEFSSSTKSYAITLARTVIEEVSRIVVLVKFTVDYADARRKLLVAKLANTFTFMENATMLLPLYAASVAYFTRENLIINFQSSVPVLGALDDTNTPVIGIIMLSLTQFSRLLVHFMLSYVGVTAWLSGRKIVVMQIVAIHFVANAIIYEIQIMHRDWSIVFLGVFVVHLLTIAGSIMAGRDIFRSHYFR